MRRIIKARSERRDVARRATALFSGAASPFVAHAAGVAGFKEARSGGTRVTTHGLATLSTAAGRGGKPISTSEQQAAILAEVHRVPDRKADQTAPWSLLLVRDALRKTALPHIAKEPIRQVLHEHGSSFQGTRTCHPGDVLRACTSGTVTTSDEQTPEKKTDRALVRASGSSGDRAVE